MGTITTAQCLKCADKYRKDGECKTIRGSVISFYLGTRMVSKRIPDQSAYPYPTKYRRTDLGILEDLFRPNFVT